ncbi:glutamate racemase [Candidatus Berkelbacteria bacterium]|nr:glutamate racemase [Candidatus Berkelbacteria bacterium]
MIGVFDSGVGGLAVALLLRQALPDVDLIYLADAQFAPYGQKSQTQIIERMRQVAQWFHGRGVRLLVMACNTATVNAIDEVRLAFPDMAFVGIEPAVKPAAQVCERIIVLGTNSTVHNERYRQLVDRYAAGKQLWHVGAPELVRQVESGELDDLSNLNRLNPSLTDVDGLVIGCTHFSFLVPTIRQHWPQLQIFDGADGVVRRTMALANEAGTGETAWFTTGPARTVTFINPPVSFAHAEL